MNLVTLSSRLTGALFLGALLAACGGGGGSSTSSAPTPTPTPACATVRIDADATVAAGKTAGATAFACAGTLADVTWTQVSGPAVTLLASRSPTVSFEPAAEGTIKLRADGHLADGTAASTTADIVVTAAVAGSSLTLRADHSVRPLVDTSVRAWPTLAAGETLTSIVWTQTAGPTVTMNTTNQRLLMFKSPATATDTVLKFHAVMTTSSGRTDADDVMVGVETQAAKPNGYMFDATERVHPYRATGNYTSVLARCVYDISLFYVSSTNNNFCPASTLPLLQTEAGPGAVPSVAQIMSRVLVSHDFLGANFEQFLLTQDPHDDFKRLFAGVSAIVLGSHVRPSYYTPATGAIYLDANNFWLKPEQRDVVTEVPDYRLAFADPFTFSSYGRAVKNNDYARRSFPTTSRISRETPELILDLGRLLYHELAHASDFAPTTDRTLTPSLSIYANLLPRITAKTLASDVMSSQYPLRSAELSALGQVLFQGAAPTDAQKAYTAAQVGAFFGADIASDDYAYSSPREDLAMLFEEFMMSYRHGVQYDIGFANAFRDGMTFDDVIVAWGERGRITEAGIKPRVKLAVDRIAPWIGGAAVDTLPAPVMMTPGLSWTANLAISPAGAMVQPSSLKMGVTAGAPRVVRDDLQAARRNH